jgi:probable rRNA maturation factor
MPRSIRKPAVAVSSWQRAVRVPRKRIAELVAFVARREGARLAEVDVAVVSRRRMADLHRRYLGRAGATDVLSFDLSDAAATGIHAQVVVCGEIAAARVARHGVGLQRELMLYVVHGLLHVLGYDDRSPRSAARIRARQEELLDAFGRLRARRARGRRKAAR